MPRRETTRTATSRASRSGIRRAGHLVRVPLDQHLHPRMAGREAHRDAFPGRVVARRLDPDRCRERRGHPGAPLRCANVRGWFPRPAPVGRPLRAPLHTELLGGDRPPNHLGGTRRHLLTGGRPSRWRTPVGAPRQRSRTASSGTTSTSGIWSTPTMTSSRAAGPDRDSSSTRTAIWWRSAPATSTTTRASSSAAETASGPQRVVRCPESLR